MGLALLFTLSQCRRHDSVDSSPCEQCVKDGVLCEYRLVDPSSASNSHASNYQDNSVSLHPVHSAPPPNQESALPVKHPSRVPTQRGPHPTFNPAMQAPFQTNPHYPTPSYKQHPFSYPVPQYLYTNTFYQPLSKYGMNFYSSNSPSPVKERRRTPMDCTNCRSIKIKVSISFQGFVPLLTSF